MAIHLETLEHQQRAIDAILSAMEGCRDFDESKEKDFRYVYANPVVKLKPESVRNFATKDSFGLGKIQNLDIKMETGTGKTFVYTQTMFELYKNFGLNKFIIFVPTPAIKEGTKHFIEAEYSKKFFKIFYPDLRIDLAVINKGDFSTKKGRKTIPAHLSDFLDGTRSQKGTIKCLLVNKGMITGNSNFLQDDFEQTMISSTNSPTEAISATRPVAIIDEPHRFKRDSKAFSAIESLNPQLILRFGATFPEIKIGKGRTAVSKKEYSNLIYDLNAVDSFNQGLIKAIDAFYPDIDGDAGEKYTVKTVTSKKLVLAKNGRQFEINAGENLPSEFEGGVFFEGGKEKSLSSGLELSVGMKLYPQTYHASYQEIMISQALNQHFEKERENWLRENAGENAAKIKTLSLFFIDSISSYRSKDGWLKSTFEKLLRAKLKDAVSKETNTEYRDFLEKSLENISECHGGYFAEDAQGKGDEQIQNEVDDILRNKNRLISFKDENGNWILRRFLFSQWTLREGWDNPNVFVISKIRSSGSEISKIQEVGRGLRLPVDENGRRISNEEFRLSYIVDFSENDFVEKLVGEIDQDGGEVLAGKIGEKIIEGLIESGYSSSDFDVRLKLISDKIIDRNGEILDSVALRNLLPKSGIKPGKIRSNPKKIVEKIKLRKENWNKIRDLWLDVSKRYMLKFEKLTNAEITKIAEKSIGENLRSSSIYNKKSSLLVDNDQVSVRSSKVNSGFHLDSIAYGDFLRKLAINTSISPEIWHKAIIKREKARTQNDFNAESLANILRDFRKVFEKEFSQKYEYKSLDFIAETSLIRNGEFVEEISKGLLGANSDNSIEVDKRNLWSGICYDSPNPEGEISKIKPGDEILVFGKIPQRAIRIPLFTGGTTSPDFIYAIRRDDGNTEINLFIEAKSNDLRESEQIAISSQESFFKKSSVWRKVTSAKEVENLLNEL